MIFRRRKANREARDNEPPIFRFLPDLGKSTPGRRAGGVVRSHETHPNSYLSARIGRAIVADDAGIPYAIPDVMATESRMHLLIQDHREKACRHPQMIQWRGALATLLLWSTWEIDENRLRPPQCREYSRHPKMPFASSILQTVNPVDWPYIRVLYLERLSDTGRQYEFPLAFVSRRTIIVPAENPIVWHDDYPEGLRPMLPDRVTWYDMRKLEGEETRARQFRDPCETLNEVDRIRLGRLLLFLMWWLERDADSEEMRFENIKGTLQGFVDDMERKRNEWTNRLTGISRGAQRLETDEWRSARWRARAAFSGIEGVTEEPFSLLDAKHIQNNFLISALIDDPARREEITMEHIRRTGLPPDGGGSEAEKICYSYRGVPFAVSDEKLLLCPYDWDSESETARETLCALQEAVRAAGAEGHEIFAKNLNQKLRKPALHDKLIQIAREWMQNLPEG